MTRKKPYFRHLMSSDDLVTTYEAVRAGFVALALERNRRATPFVAEARALQVAASQAVTANDLTSISGIETALLTAAGISDKAAKYLRSEDKAEAIQGLIRNFLEPAGADFVEELVFRFLLTRGDTLGGSTRNVGGALALRKLTRILIATLNLAGSAYQWLPTGTNRWAAKLVDDADIELHLCGLSWHKEKESRVLVFNRKVPQAKNNVDLCLLDCHPDEITGKNASDRRTKKKLPETAKLYLALGELKGGIDPAGADEHWKTARTALTRIREGFSKQNCSPHTFFIGAAIEKKMADEIWSMLSEGALENAANLSDETQLASIARWLCEL